MKLPDKIPGLTNVVPKPEDVGVVPSEHIPDAHKATPETVVASAGEFYSEDEERDDHGRWTGPGGGGSSDESGDGETDTSYRGEMGTGSAPSANGGAPMSDLTKTNQGEEMYPEDVYDQAQQARLYASGFPEADRESFAAVNAVRGNPDAKVMMYRAVPPDVTKINPGDWVTPSQTYANQHLASVLGGDGHVISAEARAGDLYSDANSINEFGWDPKDGASSVTAAGAPEDARGEIAAVAEKVNPLAVDYGQTAYDAETGTVYWVCGDGTSDEELEQAREAFLAIDGVEQFEYEAEGMPTGWCGAEVVYGSDPFRDSCGESAALLEVLQLASVPLALDP